jgi:hypothetical protein
MIELIKKLKLLNTTLTMVTENLSNIQQILIGNSFSNPFEASDVSSGLVDDINGLINHNNHLLKASYDISFAITNSMSHLITYYPEKINIDGEISQEFLANSLYVLAPVCQFFDKSYDITISSVPMDTSSGYSELLSNLDYHMQLVVKLSNFAIFINHKLTQE